VAANDGCVRRRAAACGGGGVRWMGRSSGLVPPRVRINLQEDFLSSVLCGQRCMSKVLFLKMYIMIKYDT
jgi:hypothetical protein